MTGPFTATVEIAGPFRIEGKLCAIAGTQAFAAGRDSAKSRIVVTIFIGIIAATAAAVAIHKKKNTV